MKKMKIGFEEAVKIQEENVKEMILFLLENTDDFLVICHHTFLINFEPKLPDFLYDNTIQIYTAFGITNYSIETAYINEENDTLEFQAAFGENYFETTVKIPLKTIYKIQTDIGDNYNEVIYENPLINKDQFRKYFVDLKDKNKSLNIFLNNPENKKFFK